MSRNSLLVRLARDEAGFMVSSELVLIAVLLVIGMIVGLTTIRDQTVQELGDFSAVMGVMTQSYSITAVSGHTSSSSGSDFVDRQDYCDAIKTPFGCNIPTCITTIAPASQEQ